MGLGSIWKFPYEVGANGGGAFVLFYVAGLVIAVVPLMLAEFAIGRAGGGDAVSSIEKLAAARGAARAWRWAGMLGIAAGVLVLSFYSVIGGWILAYAAETLFVGLPGHVAQTVQARYDGLLASPGRMVGYHAVFLALSAMVVARGVGQGIEAACRILMPVLFALMLGLALFSAVQGNLGAALRFLFAFDGPGLSARGALEALGPGSFPSASDSG